MGRVGAVAAVALLIASLAIVFGLGYFIGRDMRPLPAPPTVAAVPAPEPALSVGPHSQDLEIGPAAAWDTLRVFFPRGASEITLKRTRSDSPVWYARECR